MFSDRLKRLRARKKLSQQDMANYLGITRQGYAKYENKDSEPSFDMLQKLSNFFDVTTDYLIGKSDNPNQSAEEEFQVFKNDPELQVFYKELPESDEEEVRILRDMWEVIKKNRKK